MSKNFDSPIEREFCGSTENLEECSKCGKIITTDEYVVNWCSCDECFYKNVQEYYDATNERKQSEGNSGEHKDGEESGKAAKAGGSDCSQ